jgi:hypothetical protein
MPMVSRSLSLCGLVVAAVLLLSSAGCQSVCPRLDANEASYVGLSQAQVFVDPAVAEGTARSNELCVVRRILASPDRESWFNRLWLEKSTVAKLYALVGLYFADRDFFADALAELEASAGEEEVIVHSPQAIGAEPLIWLLRDPAGKACDFASGCMPGRFRR